MSNSAETPSIPTPPAAVPRPAVRAVVSVLVAVHVFAVFLGPWAMAPSSELAGTFRSALAPYLDILSLGNGYKFFAPEPGPSHLVRYEVTLPDGSLRTGVFPNREEHKPRLLYHRHFMLSEFVNTLEAPGAANERSTAYSRSYARHLAELHDADSVKLYLRRHYVPRMEEVRQGMKLSDPALYQERLLVEYKRDQS